MRLAGMELPGLTERLGDYTRILRRRADASQREMATRARVSLATIAALESGRLNDVRLQTYARLASAGGCVMVLMDTQGAPVQPYPAQPMLNRGWRRLPAHLDPRQWVPPLCYWTPPHGEWTFDRDRAERDRRRESPGGAG